MPGFIERHLENILGHLSSFDRIIIQGTLPDICHPGAITSFFYRSGIRIFDFKQWASPMRDVINESTRSIANPGRKWLKRPSPPDRMARTGQVSRSSISN